MRRNKEKRGEMVKWREMERNQVKREGRRNGHIIERERSSEKGRFNSYIVVSAWGVFPLREGIHRVGKINSKTNRVFFFFCFYFLCQFVGPQSII